MQFIEGIYLHTLVDSDISNTMRIQKRNKSLPASIYKRFLYLERAIRVYCEND